MKAATYNIWDSQAGMPERYEQIIGEIRQTDAGIICLQEAGGEKMLRKLAEDCGYPHLHWNPNAGTAMMSRYCFEEKHEFECVAAGIIRAEGKRILVLDVHLPWKSVLEKERIIAEIIGRSEKIDAEYTLLAGDFNSSDQSSVHRFLKGDQSLMGCEAYYFDMAEVWAEMTGMPTEATLNFRENPRWGVVNPINTIEVNQRFDRIYLKNPYPQKYPCLRGMGLFGKTVSMRTGLCASDHYGLWAELEMD